MAYYGIPSAGLTLSASNGNDTVSISELGGTLITAQSVYGADGNDVISIGAVGRNASASVSFSAISGHNATNGTGATGELVATIGGSATYSTSTAYLITASGKQSATVTFTTAVTSQKAVQQVNGAYFQGNAGNDSIAFGELLSAVSATTFAGGKGNDVIGTYTNFNNVWAAGTNSATWNNSDIEGGLGNDTITLNGNARYTAFGVNANGGDDVMQMDNVSSIATSKIGLGAGNDIISGGSIASAISSTIAGGLGNDTIVLDFTNAQSVVIAGDRDGDFTVGGNDSIRINGATIFSANTIYGGGGNDTIHFTAGNGATVTALIVNANAGADKFDLGSGGVIDSTIGLGNQGDIFTASDSGQILSSRINLGKGLDTTYFGNGDIGSGADFGSTTLYGGAGADYLLGSAANFSAGDTSEITVLYQANSESTISAYDTIAVNATDDDSATYVFRYEPGATRASFSAAGVTATNGVVTFSSTFATDVTARVAAIASNTSDGNAAAFQDQAGYAYLFVKGSSDDLVVQVGSAVASGAAGAQGGIAGLTINASNNIDLTIQG